MGLFDIFNRLDTITNNGLNLIHDKKTKNLLYTYYKKSGKIEGLLQVFHSVGYSGHNPNYKQSNIGFVRQEYFFMDGLPNGYFKEYDSNGNLYCHIENIKSNSFNFKLTFSIIFLKSKLLFSDKYQINGFVNEYYTNNTLSSEKKVKENKLISSKSYYQNGQLRYDEKKGIEYYENGQLKNDKKKGTEYYEDGILKSYKKFGEEYLDHKTYRLKSDLKEHKEYNEKGVLIYDLKGGKEFNKNGQLKSDLKEGKEYYENGKLKSDLKEGKEYYENGNIKIDNPAGKNYLKSKNLNLNIFNGIYSFDELIHSNKPIKKFNYFEYFKEIYLFDMNGILISKDEIIDRYHLKYDKIRRIESKRRLAKSGIRINMAPERDRVELLFHGLILINSCCFSVEEEIFFSSNGNINLDDPYSNYISNICLIPNDGEAGTLQYIGEIPK